MEWLWDIVDANYFSVKKKYSLRHPRIAEDCSSRPISTEGEEAQDYHKWSRDRKRIRSQKEV